MSKDLLRQLRSLEEEYPDQPIVAQLADLRAINEIRSQLGMPLVDARLNEVGVAVEADVQPEVKPIPDHTEAREIYQTYLRKIEELEVHRAYAAQVSKATSNRGMTPVRPLATLGTNGGPLLCDQCGKAIVLEGGVYNGVAADVAWQRNPDDKWTSWISGGMVVEKQTNGTLRIYHGYPGGHQNHCCTVASREDREARAKFKSSNRSEKQKMILAFLEHEFPDKTKEEHLDLLNQILDTLYSYDPGIGVNRPGEASEEPAEPDTAADNWA